jgi:hypothetical protein
MTNEIVHIPENDYNEILLRCVSVIESARSQIAKHIANTDNNAYWEIGELLYEREIDSKHGSSVVKRLSIDLKERFPNMGTSHRQL